MINSVILHGRIATDIELRHTASDIAVCTFTIANETGFGDNKKSHFIECVAWRQTAEFISKCFAKGQEIAIKGTLQTRNWEDKQGNKRKSTEVIIDDADFCGPRASQSDSNVGQGNYTRQAQQTPQRAAQALQKASQPQATQQDDFMQGFMDENQDLPF